jgi:mannose-6-phosphate isomerase
LERAAATDSIADCLHVVEPAIGDCLFIPSGTVHALGAGLLVAEIQQASDTTYRLYDWNRVGPDGIPRPLHWQQALEVIDFGRGPVEPQRPQRTDRAFVERLVACQYFVLDRWRLTAAQPLVGDSRDASFHLLAVLDGAVGVSGDPSGLPLSHGQTMLVPAETADSVVLQPVAPTTLLDIYLTAQ